jgi:glycosyltransferase involved in cell wall biosynthesis
MTAAGANGAAAAAPFLTVVMPAHCGERWIEATLDSLAAEATPDIEVIVIDGSPDSGTANLVRRYADRLSLELIPRFDLNNWRTKTNFGVERAKASHVCMLCQDDLWLPGRAAAIRRWIDEAPDAVLHLAPTAIVDHKGRSLGIWRCPLPSDTVAPSALVLERLLVQNFIASPTPVFRRDAWLACNGLDVDLWYTADWDVWLKLARQGPVRYHDFVSAGFRIHNESMTMSGSRDPADFESQMRIVLDRHVGQLTPARSAPVVRAAQASIKVNIALAAASGGSLGALGNAAAQLLLLGPLGLHRYLRDSRLFERVVPRLRAKLSGAL